MKKSRPQNYAYLNTNYSVFYIPLIALMLVISLDKWFILWKDQWISNQLLIYFVFLLVLGEFRIFILREKYFKYRNKWVCNDLCMILINHYDYLIDGVKYERDTYIWKDMFVWIVFVIDVSPNLLFSFL